MKKIYLLIICCLLMAGCSPDVDSVTGATSSTQETIDAAAPTSESITSSQEPVSFTLYTPNDAMDGFQEAETQVDELTATTVLQALMEAGVFQEDVLVNTILMENSHLRLDFNNAFNDQLMTLGSTGERYFIGSVVNTFLNAFEAETLSITVNGGILESGHAVYDYPLEYYE